MTSAPGVNLTTHELVALLTFNEGESATRSRTELRLPDPAENDRIVQAGLATLLVRNLMELQENGDARPLGPAAFVASALTTATSWLTIGVLEKSQAMGAVYVVSPAGTVLLTIRPLGIFEAYPVRSDIPPVDGAIRLAMQRLQDPDLEVPASASIVISRADADGRRASLRTTGPGAWEIAVPAPAPNDRPSMISVPEDRVADELALLLG